jgi:hypothetical protein
MGSSLSDESWKYENSQEYKEHIIRKDRIEELITRLKSFPANNLTVGDILFIGEEPANDSFFSQERLNKLELIFNQHAVNALSNQIRNFLVR